MEYVNWTIFTWAIGIISLSGWRIHDMTWKKNKNQDEEIKCLEKKINQTNTLYVEIQKQLASLTTNIEWIKDSLSSKRDK